MSSSFGGTGAPRTVDVLPSHVGRRLTRRDTLLPLILAAELVAGIAFGLASHSGSGDATSVPAKLTLGPVVLSAAQRGTIGPPSGVLPVQGPVAPTQLGPAVGPLRPGTVRAPMPATVVAPVSQVAVPVAEVAVPEAPAPAPYPTHAPRDPFAPLIRTP